MHQERPVGEVSSGPQSTRVFEAGRASSRSVVTGISAGSQYVCSLPDGGGRAGVAPDPVGTAHREVAVIPIVLASTGTMRIIQCPDGGGLDLAGNAV